VVVDDAEVERAGLAVDDHLRGVHDGKRDLQRSGEIVGGAQRQDAERKPGLHEAGRGGIQAAVAAADNHHVHLVRVPGDGGGNLLAVVGRGFDQADAAVAQQVEGIVDWLGAATRVRIEQQQGCPVPCSGGPALVGFFHSTVLVARCVGQRAKRAFVAAVSRLIRPRSRVLRPRGALSLGPFRSGGST